MGLTNQDKIKIKEYQAVYSDASIRAIIENYKSFKDLLKEEHVDQWELDLYMEYYLGELD